MPGPLTLAPVRRAALRETFLETFADYAVDVGTVTERWLDVRAAKNGVDFDLSVGAYDGDRMVGMTLIGVGERDGVPAAYDAATGIVPGHRGRGLARAMFEHALPALRGRGIRRFFLEVLQENEPAIRAYRRTGFSIERELRCFEIDVAEAAGHPAADMQVGVVDRSFALALGDQLDWSPSWENDLQAVERIPDDLICLGARVAGVEAGAVVYTPVLNWVMLLVVRRDLRRRGVATALIRELAAVRREEVTALRFNNVDAGDAGMLAFVDRRGFRSVVDQYEMSRPID